MSERLNNKRLLVRGVNWIGDAVMTLPALRGLRDRFRDAEIDLMVKKWVEPVFRFSPEIDGIIEYRKTYEGIKGKIRASGALRRRRYDSAILFQNALDAAILASLAAIPERIGYARDWRGILLTKAVRISPEIKKLHHILYYLNLLRETGMSPVYRHPWIHLTADERIEAMKVLKGLSRPTILLNPGATYGDAKRWPAEYFSELITMIIRELGGSVIVTGSEYEVSISRDIIEMTDGSLLSDESFLNLTGKTSLRELISILSQVDVVITNDSGPMHLAYAVGTPLIAIFGSTDPLLTGPPSVIDPEEYGFTTDIEFGLRARVLTNRTDCSPCFERECPRGDLECLRGISPGEVFEELKRFLSGRRAVFFDRDGTLCQDADYLNSMDRFKVFHEISYVKQLKEKGFLLIGVSNQSGIARGIVERTFAEQINDIFINEYGFDAFYYCPHHPDDNCACRKPSPGMAIKARMDYNIDLRSSIVIGDKDSDMELARNIGAEPLFVSTGKQTTSHLAVREFGSLKEVVDYILEC
jgi:heptosyltransferase-2